MLGRRFLRKVRDAHVRALYDGLALWGHGLLRGDLPRLRRARHLRFLLRRLLRQMLDEHCVLQVLR